MKKSRAFALWCLRAGTSCILVFFGFICFLPAQLIAWGLGKQRWSETVPYLYLDYLFAKGVASPEETVPDFKTWKNTRFD